MYSLLRFAPRNYLSFVFGKLVSVRLPRPVAARVNMAFARTFRVNLEESEFPPEHYRSLAAFFLRNLKPGVRPIGAGVVSPADGKIVEHGPIELDRLIQAKGKSYSLRRLVRDEQLAGAFSGGYFVTVYLAPKDYHHVHSPLDGKVTACYYIPGTLWPVNSWSVENINELFCVNERLITVLETERDLVAVVKIGATNVGRISVTYDSLQTNSWSRLRGRFPPLVKREYAPAPALAKGARLGTFNLGLTVVLLFQSRKFTPGPGCKPGDIRLGQTISRVAMSRRIVRIGTRGSALALAQCELVSAGLLAAHSRLLVEQRVIITSGDKKQETPLAAQGDKKDWVLEFEQSLAAGEIHLAVHSGKDVPVDIDPRTVLLPVLPREAPNDAIVWSEGGHGGLAQLRQGAVVGTASLRRRAQALYLRPDLEVVPVRGNVPTRLRKLHEQTALAAIIVAAAGLRRLGETSAHALLPIEEMLPAVHQGTLVVQFLRDRPDIAALLAPLVHEDTAVCFRAERSCVERLGADCNSAVAVYAALDGAALTISARVLLPDGTRCIERALSGSRAGAADRGAELAELLFASGAAELLRG